MIDPKKLLLSLVLCFQLASNGLAQQPNLPSSPKPDEQKSTEQKPSEQKPPPRETDDVDVVKITTNLVQIDAVVTDRKGNHVTDLRADEMEMLENGKPQKITDFSYIKLARAAAADNKPAETNATPIPGPPKRLRREEVRRTVALIVDDLRMSFDSVRFTKEALKKFLDEQLQPTDLVAIIRTAGGTGALQTFTSDRQQLYTAVDKLKWVPRIGNSAQAFANIRQETMQIAERNMLDNTNELDDLNQMRKDLFAVGTLGALNYVIKGLREMPGRKSIILFSDGLQIFNPSEPTGSSRLLNSLQLLLDLANRASVVINTIDVRGLATLGLTAVDNTWNMSPAQVEAKLAQRKANFFDSQSGLNYLAAQTGGLAIRNQNDMNGGVKQIMQDQAGYYLVGYRPDDATFDSVKGRTRFHHVSLKVKRPGKYAVRTRTGFYGVTDEKLETAKEDPQQQLMGALLSPFANSAVQLRLTSLFANETEGSVLRSFLHIKGSDLTFTKEADGSHKAVFDLVAVTFGEDGKLVDQFADQHTIHLTDAVYQKVSRYGFTFNTTTPIKKPGAYQFRTALRDVPSNRLGSASQFVAVPDVDQERLTTSGLLVKGMPLDQYLQGASPNSGDDAAEDSDPMANTSVRQFRTGTALVYALAIYNAKLDKTTGKPNLTIQARLYRNGELVFTGNEVPFELRNQADPKRLGGGGAIQLGTTLTPGEYVLQVVVSDRLAKEKHRLATQWMDFEIVQ
ncbi:MAG TPA: VWA domain-containing protein [Pyrinomonadaceae bacterium]|nr:VWA domain-containing protein [Pyrinomonadaceae bacterium]